MIKPLVLFLLISLNLLSSGQLTFNVKFTAAALDSNTGYSASERQLFINGMNYWDSIIDGHRDNVARSFTLTVDAFSQAASGGGVLLGSAGPRDLFFSNVVADAHTGNKRFISAGNGLARFNTHSDAGTLRYSTILHEIGHTLGMGTLWEDNELYNDGVDSNHNRTLAGSAAGEYKGSFALAAYQTEFNQAASSFIPVELSGGVGTAHGHWNEQDNFGASATGITNNKGQDFRDELMTGFAAPIEANSFVSNTTIQSLRDLGYTLEPVPEPSSIFLLGLGSIALSTMRRRT